MMSFTLWDVEHGLAIWIKTPNGHNHWIDAGRNTGNDFSPAQHVSKVYSESKLDYLIISHPDSDHINDLPDVVDHLGWPRALLRNKSLPSEEKYGSGTLRYQQVFRHLDMTYHFPAAWETDPCNPNYNGGISIEGEHLDYSQVLNINDSSVVMMYLYAGWLFVLPGDIEARGWNLLWQEKQHKFLPLIEAASRRILVAPHHGRQSGYCREMMQSIKPHLILVSDDWGLQPTDYRFRTEPLGLIIDGKEVKYLTTKNAGNSPTRIQIILQEDGRGTIRQLEE